MGQAPLDDEGMAKYGVVLDDEKTKTGSKNSTCPQCGATLTKEGHCPIHGTEPFEKKP